MVAAAMTALMPGAGPPPTRMASVFTGVSMPILREASRRRRPSSESGDTNWRRDARSCQDWAGRARSVRWLVEAAGGIGISVAAVAAAWAEDSDELRGYLQLKFRGTNGTGVHDSYGFGLGVNLNRYVGVELSGDHFEIFPKVSGFGTIGEYGVFAVMPQIRLRYPFLGDKLVPYIVGGGGIAFTDFNDRKAPVFGVSVKDESATPVGALGPGIEDFLADNIPSAAEFKYLFAGDQTLQVGGSPPRINASTPLTTFSPRMFSPELRPTTFPADAPTPPPARLYVGFRAGGAVPTDTEIAPGIEAPPRPYAIGRALNEYFGVAVGLDIRRYLGVDLAVEGYETVMAVHGVGSVGEYAFYSVMPQLRLRYPLAGDRLVPYA